MLVGYLFVCGWITALWQVSERSPWKLAPLQTAAHHSGLDASPAEGKLCPWWGQATRQEAAREALLQGWQYAERSTPEADVEARWRFQCAIDSDPTYAAAYASLGILAWQDWLSWSQDMNRLAQASLYLQKAVALDSSCPQVLTLLSTVLLTQRRQAQAVAEAERKALAAPLLLPTGSSPAVQSPVRKVSTREGSRTP